METMCYYTHSKVTLSDIEELAKTQGYETLIHHNQSYNFHTAYDELHTYFGDNEHMRWQWTEYKAEDMALEEDARKRINDLNPTSILLFEYGQRWLPEIVKFMTIVLKKYGGMLDCTGDVDVMYTLENINGLLTGCP